MRRAIAIILAALSLNALASVHSFTLDNGLKLLVKEDHRTPVVVNMLWYNVGSADEPTGITGVSHALEHMMFKGTAKYPTGTFSRTVAAVGGQENAFTNYDYTAYYEKTSAAQLPTSLELEADRMQNLIFNQDEFKKEIKVIQEERRQRADDNPQALTEERFMAAANLSNPYHHPVVGWMNDLKHLNINDVQAWYESFYAPNNATLVVVGDVDPQKVYNLTKLYFGNIKKRPDYQRKPQAEAPSLGAQTIEVHAPAQVPMVMFGYRAPSIKSAKTAWEPYALEIFGAVLNAGESSRFSKNILHKRQLVTNVDLQYNLFSRYQTQFIFYDSPAEGHTLAEVKNAIINEINQLKKTPPTEAELNRIKTQIIAQKTFEKDSIMGQAMELGLLETIGVGWKAADAYTDNINAITAEQVSEVARRYFVEQALTEAHLIPQTQP